MRPSCHAKHNCDEALRSRKQPEPKKLQKGGHLENDRSVALGTHRPCEDPATRTSRYAVSTSYELHAKLVKCHPELTVVMSTLEDYFSFPGRGNAAKYPEPLLNFTESMKPGYKAAQRQCGRKPCLPGAEASRRKFETELRAMRDAVMSA